MTTFDLEDSAQMVEAIERDVEEHHRTLRADLAEGTLRHLQRLAPVDEGEHRASWTPFGAEGPGVARARAQGRTDPVPPARARQVVEGLGLEADFGFSTADPASPGLVRGASPKARPGYPLQAIKLAIRQANRGGQGRGRKR